MADEGTPSSGGHLCSIRQLLQFPEETNPKDLVFHIIHAARNQPAVVMPALMTILQQDEGSVWEKVAIYRSLRAMLERGLEVEPACSFVLTALKQLRASLLEVPWELQVAVSNALASFARRHFSVIMNELQRHLKPFAQPDEFTLLTLGKITTMNVYHCVPFFGITLTTMQTVTRRIEDTRRRWALCTALKQICKAIQIYLRTWERSSYPRISVQQFSIYLLPLYACITRTWLPGSHSKVRLAVLKALSPMLSILLPRTEFQTQIYDDIILLSLQYDSSSTEAFYISKILGQILEASLVNKNPIPSMYVGPLAQNLILQICSREQKEHLQWQSRNSVEITQLFLKLARSHPSELLRFFLKKLDESQGDMRTVVLLLLSEIVGAQLPEVWNRRLLCVKVVKAALIDDSTPVCLAMLQTIRKLLSVGYLEKIEGWPLNYIALQLSRSAHQLTQPTWNLPLGGLKEKAMERVSVDLLHFAVTSGRGASQELWKKLLNYLMQPHYTSLATPLCQALRLLAEHRLRWVVPTQATLEPVDSPTPQGLMARLIALAVCPLEGGGQGTAAILLLSALRPEFYKGVGEHWWVEVPLLAHYLEGHSKYTLPPAAWEQKLLEFLKKSLQRNQEEGWNLILGQELMKQMGVYHNSSKEKVFLYKTLGIALSATGDVGGVTQQLLNLLLHTDYTEEAQQKGVRWCLAYCAEGQLVAVLEALHHFEKEISEGKDLACFQIGQALPQPEKEHVMKTLLLLYGSVAIRVPQEQLMPHLANEIVPRILHHYMTLNNPERAIDVELVLSFAQCVSEISLSMKSKGDSTTFHLPQKRALLDLLMNTVKTESLEVLVTPVCQQVMVALRHLSKVPEMLSPEENWKLAEACLSHVFALPPLGIEEGASQTLYTGTLTSLSELMETLLEPGSGENDFSDWFQQIFQLLGYWLVSEHEWERARAMQLGVHLLKAHCQRTSTSISQNQFSHLMALLGPFTYDTLGTIRHSAGNCIRLLLNIQGATKLREPKVRVNQQRLYCIQRDLQSESTETMHTASLQLAKIVSCVLPLQGILTFLHTLLEQLRTVNGSCDKASLLWFEVAVKERRPDLKDKVHNIVDIICSFWQYSEDSAQRHFLAQAICILAEHHRKAVCFSLLEQPLLQDKVKRELWASLATYKNSGPSVLKCLLIWMRMEGNDTRSCLWGLEALHEVVLALDGCATFFPLLTELCYILLQQLSKHQDDKMPTFSFSSLESNGSLETEFMTSHGLAVTVLQAVFSRALPDIARELNSGKTWDFLMDPSSSLKGVALLARALMHTKNPFLDGLLLHLHSFLQSSRTTSRNLSLVFCMEVIGHPLLKKPETLNLLLHLLLTQVQNGNDLMRILSMRGLGNMAKGAPEEAKKYQKALLKPLLQALQDSSSPELATESLYALCKLGRYLGKWPADCTFQIVVSQACAHLRHADDTVRAAAFELLGELAKTVPLKLSKFFTKKVGGALAALLLHFHDPCPHVAQACQMAFISCASFIGLCGFLKSTNSDLLLMDLSDIQHSHLMDRVCQQLAQRNPLLLEAVMAEVAQYICCNWEEIRLVACKLAGILVEKVETQHLGQFDVEHLLQALHSASHDPSPTVISAALEATHTIQQKWQESQTRLASGHQRRAVLLGWFFRREPKKTLGAAKPGPV
ncbi:maestro heat-like repeat-containing protein family member 2A [Pituophis catenifer annectens]|uniref:maestro heat-like repeat-containing protein family member 2A n=1 Tax=Pituophis catenifer annectens TaxID=94852 RepID=UPI0039955A7A